MVFNKLLSFLLPPQCLHCKVSITDPLLLCAGCWKESRFIIDPFCKRCAHPLDLPAALMAPDLCPYCQKSSLKIVQTRCVLIYNDLAKKLIVRFKHGDATYLAAVFARWLLSISQDWLEEADYIIPVPLHWTRLAWRRYNQSALLSLYLLKALKNKNLKDKTNHNRLNLPLYAPQLLRRNRQTLSQAYKKFFQRQENVRQAFFIPPAFRARLIGKKVILIDDVITTGATINECSRVLKEAGCQQILILALARAVKAFDPL